MFGNMDRLESYTIVKEDREVRYAFCTIDLLFRSTKIIRCIMTTQALLTDKSQQIFDAPQAKQRQPGDQIHTSGKYNWFRRGGKKAQLGLGG